MRKNFRIAVILATVLLFVAFTIVVLLEVNYGWLHSQEYSAADARLLEPGYLNDSRLYLISATARYGTVSGQNCFIINATVRSDYTEESPPPGGIGNSTSAFFGITATLYHSNKAVEASDVTGPGLVPLGVPQHVLAINETGWFEIDMATNSRNVDSYSITLLGIASGPIP
jgi:hypothetical protein